MQASYIQLCPGPMSAGFIYTTLSWPQDRRDQCRLQIYNSVLATRQERSVQASYIQLCPGRKTGEISAGFIYTTLSWPQDRRDQCRLHIYNSVLASTQERSVQASYIQLCPGHKTGEISAGFIYTTLSWPQDRRDQCRLHIYNSVLASTQERSVQASYTQLCPGLKT